MKTLLIAFGLLFILSGCVDRQAYVMAEYQRNLNECRSIASEHGFRGDILQQYMSTCMHMTASSAPSYGTPTMYQGQSGMYGRADAFGPYGVWGPTWQAFNGQFQGQQSPTVIAPIR